MYLIVIILLVLLLVGGAPLYPYSAGWGWGPSGFISILLVVLLFLALMGRL